MPVSRNFVAPLMVIKGDQSQLFLRQWLHFDDFLTKKQLLLCYHLLRILKTFGIAVAFVYAKANYTEICEEMHGTPFLSILKLNYF